MKRLLILSALLFSFNGWADLKPYYGNDVTECISLAINYADKNKKYSEEEYNEYIKACMLIISRFDAERKETYEREQSEINKRIILEGERKETYEKQQKQLELRLEEERRAERERIIADLRERCVSYGFTGDNNIAACVQREAQQKLELAEKENESRERIRLAEQQSRNQSRQTQRESNAEQQADAKRQREAQALINLGALISGAGSTNNTNRATPRINSNPNKFSTTLTVPSNQNCPLNDTPLTKQEVRGSNRICYYQ
tara:strand:+ start:119 stop:895 length:777 start_codon:yes stop_codon:yes gene_type:complete